MEKNNKPSKKPKPLNNYVKFSGIAVQMGMTIFMGAYIGKWLDDKYPSNKKWFTILLTLLSVGLALYNVLRQLKKINDAEDN